MSEPLAHLNDQEIIEYTQRLVQIASVNGNEAPAAEFIAQTSRQEGLKVTIRLVDRDRPNVLVTYPGESEKIGLLFHGHTDTIPFLNMENPLSGEIIDGRIWGRGSVDQKGGLAASLLALMALRRSGIRLQKSVAVAAVIDEESEHRGSMALVDDHLQAEAAIVTEPSDLQILLANKGTAPIRIQFSGVLAHGSIPWAGVNAIEMAARTILSLKTLEMKSVEIPGIGTMQATFNVGLIEGGTAYNNVADSCSIWLDRRTVPGEDQHSALKQVEMLLEKLSAEQPTFKAKAEIARPDWKWEKIRQRGLKPALTPPDSPIVRAVAQAHEAIVGQPPTLGYTNGYNDGDFLINDLAIPTVNYGPGESPRSHTANEALLIEHLLTAVRVYLKAALILAG